MVIVVHSKREAGWLMADVIVALAVLLVALLPLAASLNREQKLARKYYEQCVVMEALDGEFELLLKGEWRKFQSGQHEYHSFSAALTNTSAGKFLLTVERDSLSLEWLPEKKANTRFLRQARLPAIATRSEP